MVKKSRVAADQFVTPDEGNKGSNDPMDKLKTLLDATVKREEAAAVAVRNKNRRLSGQLQKIKADVEHKKQAFTASAKKDEDARMNASKRKFAEIESSAEALRADLHDTWGKVSKDIKKTEESLTKVFADLTAKQAGLVHAAAQSAEQGDRIRSTIRAKLAALTQKTSMALKGPVGGGKGDLKHAIKGYLNE